MWAIILIIVLIVLGWLKLKKINQYWEKKEVPFIKPWPILGNMAPNVFRRRSLTDLISDLYKAYPDKRYIGFYQFIRPTLLIRDPELIKQITVREFDVFPEHNTFVDPEVDPLWGRNLFALRSKGGWHDMRVTLSPTFTSNKLRTMFVLMQQCSQRLVQYLQKQGETTTVELKDAFTRYTNDVIGSIAFGVTCDSLKDPDNEFYMMGKDAADFNGLRALKFFGNTICPGLMKLLNIRLINKEVGAFFSGIIKENMRVREEQKVVRQDMIHLLMEARKGRLKYEEQVGVDSGFAVVQESDVGKQRNIRKSQLTDDDVTASALSFFLAGFDTASTFMCYLAYALALHPEIQERLREEIDVASEACNDHLTYEALLGMKYLDQVTSETLRRWSSIAFTDRRSVKPFTIEPQLPGEEPLHLEAGSLIWIPLHSLHMDAKYFPDPERFDPERFSDENKLNLEPFTYLPFGTGPRNCIGSRFAVLEGKLIITELLRKYEIIPTEKTPVPIVLSKTRYFPLPEGGLWLNLKPRPTCS